MSIELDTISKEMDEKTRGVEDVTNTIISMLDSRGMTYVLYISTPIADDEKKTTTYGTVSSNANKEAKYFALKSIIASIDDNAVLMRLKDFLEGII